MTIGVISNAIILINLTEMLKTAVDLWFCISCTSNILRFWNKHRKDKETFTTTANLFQLIKNLNSFMDESSNDDTNSLNVGNKY